MTRDAPTTLATPAPAANVVSLADIAARRGQALDAHWHDARRHRRELIANCASQAYEIGTGVWYLPTIGATTLVTPHRAVVVERIPGRNRYAIETIDHTPPRRFFVPGTRLCRRYVAEMAPCIDMARDGAPVVAGADDVTP